MQLYNRGASVYNQVARRKHWSVQDLPIIKENDDKAEKDKEKARDYFINKATPDQVMKTKDAFSGNDLSEAYKRMKTTDSFNQYYADYKKKKKDEENK